MKKQIVKINFIIAMAIAASCMLLSFNPAVAQDKKLARDGNPGS